MLILKTMASSRLRGSKLRNKYCDENDKNEMRRSAAGRAKVEIENDSISAQTYAARHELREIGDDNQDLLLSRR
jgi:hypothetical protein